MSGIVQLTPKLAPSGPDQILWGITEGLGNLFDVFCVLVGGFSG
jgi:hypothetical protein